MLYEVITFLVRKDMYEALGKPDMTTPEGFLGALRAAKAKFGTVNGQPLIPVGFQEFTDTVITSYSIHYTKLYEKAVKPATISSRERLTVSAAYPFR